jgi:subtilisin family serine protease
MIKILFVFCLVVAFVMVAGRTYAVDGDEVRGKHLPNPAVYRELESSADGTAVVIVLLESGLSGDATIEQRRQTAEQVQDRVLANLSAEEFSIAYKYKNFAAMAGRVNAAGLAKLVADPHVTAVGPDSVVHGDLDDSVPFISADEVHALGYTGDGITVAVLDTGIDTDHPDLMDDIVGGRHFFNKGSEDGLYEDDNGHGTNVAGIITSKNATYRGVAPDAEILAIKVMDYKNEGYLIDWVAGVDHVVSVKDNYNNLCVMNMSLGHKTLYSECPCDPVDPNTQLAAEALAAAEAAGILTFASTGNNGSCTSMKNPACLSSTVPVAAVYDQDLGQEAPTPAVVLIRPRPAMRSPASPTAAPATSWPHPDARSWPRLWAAAPPAIAERRRRRHTVPASPL